MKNILHTLGFHDWEYMEPEMYRTEDWGFAWKKFDKPVVGHELHQRRICRICKKQELNRIQ